MKITKLIPQGYCKGVYNAIKVTLETRIKYPNEKIYILGLIIHNKLIKNELEKLNIISLYSKEKNLKLIDTTCNYVSSTYELIKNELNNNHEVIYIGIHNHPEATATISINKDKVHLIQTIDEVKELNLKDESPLITNQTTLSKYQIENITKEIKKYYPNSRLSNEQCNATRLRQDAIINIKENYDLIIIVGDKLSNNSKQLYELAKKKTNAILIESILDLDINELLNKENIAITSGASTPSSIVDQIYNFILNFDKDNKKTHIIPNIDYSNILKEFKK